MTDSGRRRGNVTASRQIRETRSTLSTETADPPDLARLVTRVAGGDAEAEAALMAFCTPRVRSMALARTRNPELARDLTQESLIAILQAARRGQIRDLDRVAGFVCGVARNIINNQHRRSARHPEIPIDDSSQIEALVAEDDHESAERQRRMTDAMSELAPADREVLTLTLVDGLKPGEIAARTGLAADVVRTRKSRAVKRILELLEERSRMASSRHIQ